MDIKINGNGFIMPDGCKLACVNAKGKVIKSGSDFERELFKMAVKQTIQSLRKLGYEADSKNPLR